MTTAPLHLDNITFDEDDLECLYDAIIHQVRTTDWDVTDPADWDKLKQVKEMEEKLCRALDAIFDERQKEKQ